MTACFGKGCGLKRPSTTTTTTTTTAATAASTSTSTSTRTARSDDDDQCCPYTHVPRYDHFLQCPFVVIQ